MIQYVQRNLLCTIDGVLMNSRAVVYKERSFIVVKIIIYQYNGWFTGLPFLDLSLNCDIEGPMNASAAVFVL